MILDLKMCSNNNVPRIFVSTTFDYFQQPLERDPTFTITLIISSSL